MSRDRIAQGLLLAAVFLLPWQTRWIYIELTIGGNVWEYGKLSLYLVEVLILAAFLLRGRPRWSERAKKIVSSAIALTVTALIFSIVSVDFALSLGSWIHLAIAVTFFFLLLDERTRIQQVVWVFVLSLVIPSILGWYQVLTGASPASTWFGLASHTAPTLGDSVVETVTGRILRAYGSFPHPNIFGGFLVVGLFLLTWLARQYRYEGRRWFLWGLTILLTMTLVITFSRSAYLALTVGVLTMVVWLLIERRAPPRKAFPLLSVGLFALLITLIIFHEPVFARFHPELRLESQSIAERQSGYQETLGIVRTYPLVGTGIGAYTHALVLVRPGTPAWGYQPVHNVFALVLAELGVLGFAAFVIFLKHAIHPLWLARRTPEGIFGLSLVTALFVLVMFDHYVWSLWPGLALGFFTLAMLERTVSKGP